MELKHDAGDLAQMQAMPLSVKIRMTESRIRGWYEHYQGNVYVSFSGGKDSTALLHMVRQLYPDVEAVFCDTGLEYPEIREFVKSFDNVTRLTPVRYDKASREYVPTNFKEIITLYGYPVISKEVSQSIFEARHNGKHALQKFDDTSEYIQKYGRRFSLSKWAFLKDSNIPISHLCCKAMKKDPAKLFEKQSGKKPMVATMACESALRKTQWMKAGCNSFDSRRPISKPLSFWTDNDILTYIKENGLEICSVYGEIVETGKMIPNILNDSPIPKLTTTKAERTGCMFCMFGCHLDKEPNRFQRMKITHPKQHEFCMKPIDEGGLGLKEVLDYIGVKYD